MGIDNKNKISFQFLQNIKKFGRWTGFSVTVDCGL